MFSHVMVGSNDIERSRRFYDALFTAVGGRPGRQDDKGRLIYINNGGVFMVTPPIDDQPATHGNGSTIGFAVDGPEQAHAWHEAGVTAGGTAIEDPPGVRGNAVGQLYLAYLRDPDGNKLCALHRMPGGGLNAVLEVRSEARSHGGRQLVCAHQSQATGTEMVFSLFLPPAAEAGPVPLVTYLSGLTCTHANVTDKGEYRAACAELGLAFLAPDTSPRGEGVADEDGWDIGQGAGFYVDATQAPWSDHYRMWSYVTEELPVLVAAEFPVDMAAQGITGHSMGGHGALTVALRSPGRFRSVSAFAPIVAPSQVPWGENAFSRYLGEDRSAWARHDAVALIENGARLPDLLVDIGEADSFGERELRPELLEAACSAAEQKLTLRRQPGYDHSYFFISTFMAEHLRWHAERLR